jgi:hypothetical protein
MDFGEIGWSGMDWIGLSQDGDNWKSLVKAVMDLQVPYYSGSFLSGCTTSGLCSSAQLHRVLSTKLVN